MVQGVQSYPPPCILLCMVSFLSFSRLCDHFGCCTLTEEWLKCSCIYAIFGFSLKGYELFQPFDFCCGSDDRTESDGNQGVGIIPKMNKYRSVSAILQSTCNSQSDHTEVKKTTLSCMIILNMLFQALSRHCTSCSGSPAERKETKGSWLQV